MRSTIWKKTLICLGAVLFLESPAVGTAFAYTVKAENTDAEADASNIKSILLIGQDKREGESRQRSDSMICLLSTYPCQRDGLVARMPSCA